MDRVICGLSPLIILIVITDLPRAIKNAGWFFFWVQAGLFGGALAVAFAAKRLPPGVRMFYYCGAPLMLGIVWLLMHQLRRRLVSDDDNHPAQGT